MACGPNPRVHKYKIARYVLVPREAVPCSTTSAVLGSKSGHAWKRIERHERHMTYLFAETLKERELDLGALEQLDPLSKEELEQAGQDFGRFGQLGWTGHGNIVSLFETVEEQWGDEKERGLLAHVRSIALRYANLTVHNTATSIARPTFLEDGTPSNSLRWSPYRITRYRLP
jgi:hypothetical protein